MGSWPKTKWISRENMDQIFELVRKPNQIRVFAYSATWGGVVIEGSWHRPLGPSVQLLAAVVATQPEERSELIKLGHIELLRGFDCNARRVSDNLFMGHASACDALIDLMASYCEQCPYGLMATALPSILCMDPRIAVEITSRTIDKLAAIWPVRTGTETIRACRTLMSKSRKTVDHRSPSASEIHQTWQDLWRAIDIASRACIDPTKRTNVAEIARRMFCDSVRESAAYAYSSIGPQ